MLLPMISLIQQLKKQRKVLNISQKELGQKLGLPQSHISNIESGKTDPRLSTLQDMALLLEMELSLIPHRQAPLIRSLLSDDLTDNRPRFLPDEEGEE